jgi:uroporphyrinogen-III synthase
VVVLTREDEDNRALAALLEARGVPWVSYPCLRTHFVPRSAWDCNPGEYGVLAFTSRRGVRGLHAGLEGVLPGEPLLAAVGRGTCRALEELFGRAADVIAHPPTGAGLAETLIPRLGPGDRVLLVRGDRTSGTFQEALRRAGHHLDELIVYEQLAPRLEPLSERRPVILVLASPSAARRFLELHRGRLAMAACVAIGPTTAAAVEALGAGPVLVAEEPTNDALVRRVIEVYQWTEMEQRAEQRTRTEDRGGRAGGRVPKVMDDRGEGEDS